MDNLAWGELPELFDGALGFLYEAHGFQPHDRHISELVFGRYYLRHRVGIQVSLDRRDRCLDSYLLRLTDGKVPEGWALDAASRHFRVRLAEALLVRRIALRGVSIPRDSTPQVALGMQLQWVAGHIREHFPDILADSDALFLDFDHPK